MKQELLLESSLKDLRLSRFVQSYQSLAQEAARTNLSYERYRLILTLSVLGCFAARTKQMGKLLQKDQG